MKADYIYCNHQWLSADNKYITGASFCELCHLIVPTANIKEVEKEHEKLRGAMQRYTGVLEKIIDVNAMAEGRRIFKEHAQKTCSNSALRECMEYAAKRALRYCEQTHPTGSKHHV